MFNLTDKEKACAVVDVLNHLGKLVVNVQGKNKQLHPTVGIVTITFHADGNYDLGYGGQLEKGLTLGALVDLMLHFYSTVTTADMENRLAAMVESSFIPDSAKN